jgi:threonine aldolase
MTGKEAGLFVTSGTMGNQLSIYVHTSRGDEIIVGSKAHIKNYEVGASAVISGVSYHLVDEVDGMMPLKSIKYGIRGTDVHYPDSSLICLENAHGSGKVLPLDYMKSVYTLAKENNLKVHLDGARLFNAATHLKVDASEICQYVDSVTFCLSKGLASPIGSVLCGTKEFIHKARRGRKMLGGGMRQVGVLGAAGLISLKDMTKRLNVDHENAKYLADKLHQINEIEVDYNSLDINMVFIKSSINFVQLSQYLYEKGIIITASKGKRTRIAVHNDIDRSNIDQLVIYIKEFINNH